MNRLLYVDSIIERNLDSLLVPGVDHVRAGYKLDAHGWPTKEHAVVVMTPLGAAAPVVPQAVEGVPVDVRQPGPIDRARMTQPAMFEKLAQGRKELESGAFREFRLGAKGAAGSGASTKPQIPYTGPAGVTLQPCTDAVSIVCHASPDAGWPTLQKFLQGVNSTLAVSMYDFTSGHILQAFEALTGKTVTMTLDHPAPNPSADQSDDQTVAALTAALGSSFHQAWALVETSPKSSAWIYPNAYHIKVAVRDGAVVWLSSGNFNNSNQPDIDPIGNPSPNDQVVARGSDRDWHVVIQSNGLSAVFGAYLQNDFAVAASPRAPELKSLAAEAEPAEPSTFRASAVGAFVFFAPLTIQSPGNIVPLLTPDPGVYRGEMLRRIQSAQQSLHIQLQYIHPSDKPEDADFEALIEAVAAKIAAGIDVRIILSQYQTFNGWLERLQAADVSLAGVKIQHGVHNKGFVFDSEAVVISSVNWSGDGVLRNRDAGVAIDNAQAAEYFDQIFDQDWQIHAAQQA